MSCYLSLVPMGVIPPDRHADRVATCIHLVHDDIPKVDDGRLARPRFPVLVPLLRSPAIPRVAIRLGLTGLPSPKGTLLFSPALWIIWDSFNCDLPMRLSMPRSARASAGGLCYHIINRGNARAEVFHKQQDFDAFLGIMSEAGVRLRMRMIAYCLMPNHFHLVLWPQADGDLSRWMHWVLTTHVRRYLRHYGHSGHVWQGRFKAFPIQQDEHLLTVIRYVERNPLRAGLVSRAEEWSWSSLRPTGEGLVLDPGPTPRGPDWLEFVNSAMTEAEVVAIRLSLRRDRPYGTDAWTTETASLLGLEYSLRPRGRQPRSPR
jgi:putative transposase